MSIAKYEFLGLPVVVSSPAMSDVLARVRRYAPMDVTVLIEGESGTGKEVVARALHHLSLRGARPWVDISCGALPEHLVESELFGYEKGAFSGAASAKPGLFELADGGTLFLDEIGELDPRLQVKLLRVLDCGEFFRLGGTKKVKVNVRLLAATNRSLRDAVVEGHFRKDLYHRLAQLRLSLPPLRERREDVLPIAELFRQIHGISAGFSPQAEQLLLNYTWPGNVRELRNAVIAAGANAAGEQIAADDLPHEFRDQVLLQLEEMSQTQPGGLLEAAERELIRRVMDQTGGHQERASQVLGISSRTLSRKLKAYRTEAEPAGERAR